MPWLPTFISSRCCSATIAPVCATWPFSISSCVVCHAAAISSLPQAWNKRSNCSNLCSSVPTSSNGWPSVGICEPDFVEHLAEWRFTGDVEALPEGTVFFADEPVLRVTAPIEQAQFIESRLLNLVHFQTMIASKAVRSVLAAPGKRSSILASVGARRRGRFLAARATFIAGFAGTATVAAGREFGVPLFGTMAHSLVQTMGDDADALLHYARACPQQVTYLLDTYDTEEAARTCVRLQPVLAREGISCAASVSTAEISRRHARNVRRIFDEGGCGR